MSNWLTVRLTDNRSSARNAPISYTPPVKPPPPSTRAVLERLRDAPRRDPAPVRSVAAVSSLTTFPIGSPDCTAANVLRPKPSPLSAVRYPQMRAFVAALLATGVLFGAVGQASAQPTASAQRALS